MFNRYRPDGQGLESLLGNNNDVEREVLARIRRVFDAASSGWDPCDLYFVVRQPTPVNEMKAIQLAETFLNGLKNFADFLGDAELRDALEGRRITLQAPKGQEVDEDTPTMVYECLTDFLAEQQPAQNDLFALKEAIYSMANDYFLMAFILWPAMKITGPASNAFDGYYELWRCGIGLKYFAAGDVAVTLPFKRL
jgi:hypothetical protein